MSFALMEATEEACFSAVTPTSMSTAVIVNKVAARRGRKGMLYVSKRMMRLKLRSMGTD